MIEDKPSRNPEAYLGRAKDIKNTPNPEIFPTFEAMRPEAAVAKTFQTEGIDIRQASKTHHQDGVVFNSESSTIVVCDGMSAVGTDSPTKNYFAFALAHSVAELPDIHVLQAGGSGVAQSVERAKGLLQAIGISPQVDLHPQIKEGDPILHSAEVPNKYEGLNKNIRVGSTIAAVQRIEGTNDWRVVTIGDSNVVVVNGKGEIKQGYGEAWQLIAKGRIDSKGRAERSPTCSYIGIGKDDADSPFAKYGALGLTAQFTTITGLEEGDKIVLSSDAYLSKSPLEQLFADVNKTPDEWNAGVSDDEGGMYGDDATLVIIDPFKVSTQDASIMTNPPVDELHE